MSGEWMSRDSKLDQTEKYWGGGKIVKTKRLGIDRWINMVQHLGDKIVMVNYACVHVCA